MVTSPENIFTVYENLVYFGRILGWIPLFWHVGSPWDQFWVF